MAGVLNCPDLHRTRDWPESDRTPCGAAKGWERETCKELADHFRSPEERDAWSCPCPLGSGAQRTWSKDDQAPLLFEGLCSGLCSVLRMSVSPWVSARDVGNRVLAEVLSIRIKTVILG